MPKCFVEIVFPLTRQLIAKDGQVPLGFAPGQTFQDDQKALVTRVFENRDQAMKWMAKYLPWPVAYITEGEKPIYLDYLRRHGHVSLPNGIRVELANLSEPEPETAVAPTTSILQQWAVNPVYQTGSGTWSFQSENLTSNDCPF